jgi:hypothetical protein
MKRPAALSIHFSLLLLTLGGAVATLLLSALLFLAPVLGFPFVDFPHLVGGIFTGNPELAFWIGFAVFFLTGWLVFAPLMSLAWLLLPGDSTSFVGALVHGASWGFVLWVASGFLIPLFGALNRIEGLENPGFFALGQGVAAALGVLLGHLVYGVTLSLIAGMGRGISPLESLGWMGYRAGGWSRAESSTTFGA